VTSTSGSRSSLLSAGSTACLDDSPGGTATPENRSVVLRKDASISDMGNYAMEQNEKAQVRLDMSKKKYIYI
jgi:hypothetical protein